MSEPLPLLLRHHHRPLAEEAEVAVARRRGFLELPRRPLRHADGRPAAGRLARRRLDEADRIVAAEGGLLQRALLGAHGAAELLQHLLRGWPRRCLVLAAALAEHGRRMWFLSHQNTAFPEALPNCRL